MRMRMKKLADGVVLACLRDRHGAEVQRTSQGGFFALHDLLHYAVESTLRFDEAFLGLMESGWSFDNFTRHDDPRYRPLPAQAHIAEHLVNILSLHLRDADAADSELVELLADENGSGVTAPKLRRRRLRRSI